MRTGEGGGENFQLPSALGNLPKNVFRHGCLLRNENGRGSRERSTSMNARVWGRRPTENKENPGPATSRHAYNYKERDKKSTLPCMMCEVGPLWIGCPCVSVEVFYLHMGVPGFYRTSGVVFGKRPQSRPRCETCETHFEFPFWFTPKSFRKLDLYPPRCCVERPLREVSRVSSCGVGFRGET